MNMDFQYKFITDKEWYNHLLFQQPVSNGTYKRSIKMDLYLADSGTYYYSYNVDLRSKFNYKWLSDNFKVRIIFKNNIIYVEHCSAAHRKEYKPLEKV